MEVKPEDPRVIKVAEAMVRAKHGEHNAKTIIPAKEEPPPPGVRVQKLAPNGLWHTALQEARVFVAALDAAKAPAG